jgi:hypothetical protein
MRHRRLGALLAGIAIALLTGCDDHAASTSGTTHLNRTMQSRPATWSPARRTAAPAASGAGPSSTFFGGDRRITNPIAASLPAPAR